MMSRLRLALVSTALAALGSCASTPPPVAGPATPVTPPVLAASSSDKSSIYGLYLAGQTALYAGDNQAASEFFDRAAGNEPKSPFLKERAFFAALLAGDISKAAALAPGPGEASEGGQALGLLVQGTDALAEGRNAEAWAKLSQAPEQGASDPTTSLLRPWAAAAAGRTSDSIAVPSTGDRLLGIVAGIDQGLLFERAHRNAEAETAFKALMVRSVGKAMVGPIYGGFLERRGRRQEALAVYNELLAAQPDDPVLLADRARVLAKRPAPAAPTIREGAASALIAPAAAALADRQPQAALVYLRLALTLDPKRDDAWLLVGDVLTSSGDVEGARAAFAKVAPGSPRFADARGRLAWSYQQGDDKAQALKIARETVQQLPSSDEARMNLADILRANDQFEESARTLDPVITSAGARADWRLYYMRAVALERSGHWPEAQRDLSKALAMKPDEPEVLNYLGYSWVNRGEKVKEGMALIQKAVTAQPEEGAYVDSLGWAYYRTGDYGKAVQVLEQAVSLDAGDAEINDHLGDAYWRVGRKDEARFQWANVLTLKPDAEVKHRAETKLASPLGLEAVPQPAPVREGTPSA
jgi:tetratricopeptide (TPR) repeat protein